MAVYGWVWIPVSRIRYLEMSGICIWDLGYLGSSIWDLYLGSGIKYLGIFRWSSPQPPRLGSRPRLTFLNFSKNFAKIFRLQLPGPSGSMGRITLLFYYLMVNHSILGSRLRLTLSAFLSSY